MLTLEQFEKLPEGEIFQTGLTTNDENGAYMTNHKYGHSLRYIAKKGYANDWALYVSWDSKNAEQVAESGDKVILKSNIMNIVPCTEEVFKRYRF